MIGLMGAHRTGKTTLAQRFAEECQVPFVTSSTSQVFADLGLDVREDYPFDVRLQAQAKVLERMAGQYDKVRGAFVTDRTPLDALAYTLADVQKINITPREDELVQEYMTACFDLTNDTFYSALIVPPGLPYVVEPGKPPPNASYQEHIHSLVFGLVMDERARVSCTVLPRNMTALPARMQSLAALFQRSINQMEELRRNAVIH